MAADKPAGLTTHTSLNEIDKKKSWVDQRDGFMEWLEPRVGRKLFPVHRLDRETTGVLLFATNREDAEIARELFEDRQIAKTYLFITDRSHRETSFEAESFIERVGNEYVSKKQGTPNAKTRFEKVSSYSRFTLWRAFPETGKPHQIRLHAEDAAISILGDTVHGGSEYPTLCLHSAELQLPSIDATTAHDTPPETFTSPAPIYFRDLSLLEDRRLVRWLAAVDRRERMLVSTNRSLATIETLRWIHSEGDPLRIEQLGPVINLNWFSEKVPNAAEWISIEKLLNLKNWNNWYLQLRTDRGKDPITAHALTSEPPPPDRWTAKENSMCFEFRRETGLSPGLFLDQRKNREWIAAETNGDSQVLNLFCYTAGFSIAAAKAGAKKVVSVDVSKPFLEWSKKNFELNGLDTASHEFRAMDAGEYLAWALKKDLKFDLIVCDPPSFARTNTKNKSSVFRIEVEFDSLLAACLKILNDGGKILYSTNFEQWSLDDFAARAQAIAKKIKPQARLRATPSGDLDFELPRSQRHMKSLIIEV